MNIKFFPREYLLKILLAISANNNCFSFENSNFKKIIVIHPHDGSSDSGGRKIASNVILDDVGSSK